MIDELNALRIIRDLYDMIPFKDSVYEIDSAGDIVSGSDFSFELTYKINNIDKIALQDVIKNNKEVYLTKVDHCPEDNVSYEGTLGNIKWGISLELFNVDDRKDKQGSKLEVAVGTEFPEDQKNMDDYKVDFTPVFNIVSQYVERVLNTKKE
ncbi:hypothetical protein K9L97_01105 [Candidatus Woesearchaeota archaeon]|nr:hypothetical protein [Candidatus Woesearchaeota archaeon]